MLTKEEIKNNIVSLFFKCFDCKVPLIQILTISRTDSLAKLIDFSEIKNKLLPRILLLCDDNDQKVKRTALRFIHSKLSVCDASLAQNGLLKMIERNLVSGNSPSTNMLLLDILKEISGSFSTEVKKINLKQFLDDCCKGTPSYDPFPCEQVLNQNGVHKIFGHNQNFFRAN